MALFSITPQYISYFLSLFPIFPIGSILFSNNGFCLLTESQFSALGDNLWV